MEPQETKKGICSKVGVIVGIIVVIALGGYLYINKGSMTNDPKKMAAPLSAPVSKSDEVTAIEADLKADTLQIDLSGLDSVK